MCYDVEDLSKMKLKHWRYHEQMDWLFNIRSAAGGIPIGFRFRFSLLTIQYFKQ